MNHNAFLFPMYIKAPNIEYYCMMYNALDTLYKTGFNDEFDLFVYYFGVGYDIRSYKHFDGPEDIFVDFPKVNFIHFPFDISTSSDVYFFKWKFVDHFFNHHNYDKVFITDSDLIFNKNPSYMFEKYGDDSAYVLWEDSNPIVKKVLGRNGVAGGQIMLSRKLYQNNIINLYDKISKERNLLLSKAKAMLSEQEYLWFDNLSDQYSLMNTLINSNINIQPLDIKDICYGIIACNIEKYNDKEIKINFNTNILHYLGPYAYLFLPDRFKTQEMRQRFTEKIQEPNIIYY